MAIPRFFIVLLSICLPMFAPAQESQRPSIPTDRVLVPIDELPAKWRNRVRDARTLYAARANLEPPGGVQAPLHCNVVYKMAVIFWGDPHLNVVNPAHGKPDGIRLVGPNPATGKWLVNPENGSMGPWAHPWKENVPYFAIPIPVGNPDKDNQGRFIRFGLYGVRVTPHDNQPEELHEYEMRITAWHNDGCPDDVEFLTLRHEGGPISDDPGHGGAMR